MLARGLTLGRRIGLLVVLGLAIVLSLFGFLSIRSLEDSSQRALHERLVAAQLTASHVNSFLSLYLDFLFQLANSEELDLSNPDPAPVKSLLQRLRVTRSGLAYGTFLTNRQGVVIGTEPASMGSGPEYPPGYAMVQQVFSKGRGSVSGVFADRLGKQLVALGVPLRGRDGQSVGVAVKVFDLSEPLLEGFVQQVSLGRTAYADIVDSQGLVLASSDNSRLFQKSDHTDQFASLIRAGQPTVGACHDCHQPVKAGAVQPEVLAFAPLTMAPWGVAIRQSEDEALGPTGDLERSLAVAAAISLLAAVGMVGIGSRVVVWPLRELTGAARRIAAGDLESRVKSTGPAEVGELARAFDEMRERLKTSLGNLEQVKAGLELNVEQRTRQLSALLEVSKVLASTLDLRQLLDAVAARTGEVVELADAGIIALYNDRSQRLEIRAFWGYGEEIMRLSLAPGEGLLGIAFARGEPILLDVAEAVRKISENLTPENWAWRAQARQGLALATSVMALPLVVKGRVTGVMALEHYRTPGAFSSSDSRLAEALADQVAVAVENARLYREVLEKEKLRGELLDKVIVAQEEERQRIARELHDDTCQSLAALAIILADVEDNLPDSAEAALQGLARVKTQLQATLTEVRALALNLRPSMLDDLGLKMAIDWYAKDQLAKRGLEVSLELDGLDRELPSALETVLFRITQEALNNVVKHSGASSATVRLKLEASEVVLEVGDEGLGFDAERVLDRGDIAHSLGLHGMIERASLSGGTLRVLSTPGRGTLVRAALPLLGA